MRDHRYIIYIAGRLFVGMYRKKKSKTRILIRFYKNINCCITNSGRKITVDKIILFTYIACYEYYNIYTSVAHIACSSHADPKASGTNTRVLRSRQRVISGAASDTDYTPAGRDVIIQSNGPR